MDCFGQSRAQLAGVGVEGLYYPINYQRQFTHTIFCGMQKGLKSITAEIQHVESKETDDVRIIVLHVTFLGREYNGKCSHTAGDKTKENSATCCCNPVHKCNSWQSKDWYVLMGI